MGPGLLVTMDDEVPRCMMIKSMYGSNIFIINTFHRDSTYVCLVVSITF